MSGCRGTGASRRGLWILAAVVASLVPMAAGIGPRQPLTGDEVIVLSVSETLVRENRLGAPIFSGVGSAERHYFASLPLIHVLHWPVLKVLGTGVTQARLVSVILVVLLTVILAWMVDQRAGALAAVALAVAMLYWRNELTAVGWGLPLPSAARSARYDAAQLAMLGFTFAAMVRWFEAPSRTRSVLLGVLAGASALTHFVGVIAPAMLLIGWMAGGRGRPSPRALSWVGAGLLLATVPYGAYVVANWPDAAAQYASVHGARGQATLGVFANLMVEPRRYAHLPGATSPGPWLWLAAVAVAARWFVRNWRHAEHGALARVAGANVVAAVGLLAFFEPTKAPLYALPLLVPIGVGGAMAFADAWRSGGRVWRTFLALILAAVLLEGLAAMALEWRAARERTAFEEISRAVRAAVPAGAAGTGATRWWRALGESGYVPFVTLMYRSRPGADGSGSGLRETWSSAGIGYVVRSPEFDADVERSGVAAERVARILRECGRLLLRLEDATYGPLEVVGLGRPCPALEP